MKRTFYLKNSIVCLICIFIITSLQSCGSSNNDAIENIDKTELNASITSCDSLLNISTTTDYPETSITAFEKVVSAVETAITESNITQTAVNNMIVHLNKAKTTFLATAYGTIDSSALLASWSFDEGSGTYVTSTGVKKWIANFQSGPSAIFGTKAGYPQFVDGVQGKAISLSKGAHLTVDDYNPSLLLGNKLSISVWVKPAETRSGNYILSLNYWESWKFNLQSENKPFFTIATAAGTVDADNEVAESAPLNTWTHLVVVLNLEKHTLSFYVNGKLTKTWDSTNKGGLAGSSVSSYTTASGAQLPLIIGACTTYDEASTWSWFTPTEDAWDGFIGCIDELNIYSIALTDGQVSKLYNDEK